MATAANSTPAQEERSSISGALVIVIVGFLATTLAQPQGLGRIPIQNLLKNSLHISRTANAAFFFWIGLPWYFKPLIGVFTDAIPCFGSRRKTYILLNSLLATISWLGLYFTPMNYNKYLHVGVTVSFFMVVASTVLGAYMVEAAQSSSCSGRLTAARQVTYWITIMVSGPVGGYLASIAFGATIGISSALLFLLVPVTFLFLHEHRKKVDSRELLQGARKQLVNIGTAGTMWAASGLMALFYIAPGFTTALFYRQQDLLHLDTRAIGTLQAISGALGIVGALGYGYVCKRLNLRNLLLICLTAATVTNLAYMVYFSYARARVIDGLNGLAYSLAECTLMDLAIRATPKGSEGLGFSLMMSVRNFALFGTDILGSWLLDKYHFSFNSLVISNSATTAIAVPLVLLLPLYLIGKKDAMPLKEIPAPKVFPQETVEE
jgi:predicted MFS family arabinose efflux permease